MGKKMKNNPLYIIYQIRESNELLCVYSLTE